MVPRLSALASVTLLLVSPGRAWAETRVSTQVAAAQSAGIDKYIEKGFPSPDRPWSANEYQAFAEAMDKIKADGSLPIPRKGDTQTGPLFDRLVSTENLEMSQTPSLPVGTRLVAASNLMLKLSPVLLAYYDQKAAHQEFGAEVLEVMAYILQSEDVMCAVAQQFLDGLSPQERGNPARVDGLKKMKGGVAQTINGALSTLNELSQYEKADLDRFAKRLVTLLPPLWPRIDETVRLEFSVRVKKLAESHTDDAIRQSMVQLESALKNSSAPPR
jgi:hypothetical protein